MESNKNYGKATKSKVGEEKGVYDEYRFSSKGVNMSIWGSQGRVVYRACSEGIEGIQYSVKKKLVKMFTILMSEFIKE